MTHSLSVLRSDSATATGRGAGRADAKFYSALPKRLAGSRTEPLTRSHRVSNSLSAQADGWRPAHDCLQGGRSDRPAVSQARDHTPGPSTR